MNFDDLSFDELDQQAIEKLVFDNGEMSPILKGHIFVEKILETLISSHLRNPEAFFSTTRSFSLKADLALAMGLIDKKYYAALKAINKIRNNYAHKHEYSVSTEELNSLKVDWADIQNRVYEVALSRGSAEAGKIATIYLCWKAITLLKKKNA